MFCFDDYFAMRHTRQGEQRNIALPAAIARTASVAVKQVQAEPFQRKMVCQ
jgi:hypothetical protein